MSESQVGFIGLGNMGGRMTACITRSGRDVLGFDVKTENVSASGARVAASVGDLVAHSDVILISLPDSKVVESVFFSENGVLANVRSGQIIVDLSTSSPNSTRKIHQMLADHGVAYLDAGISGGAAAAEKAALTLMVGGEIEALDSVRSILDLFASKIFYCGPTGAGHVTKLLNNFLNGVSLAATAEVMVVGKKAGLDLQVLLDVINASSGTNFATVNRFPKIIHGDYLKGGLTNTLMLKDIALYADLATAMGVVSLNSAGPIAAFGLARSLGYADEISNTVVDAIGDLSGGVRLYDKTEEGKK
ncbi:MAG TPA: NAD(P)-dependent oxidoreductase [Candidatus Nanopelagicaceae bacterium]